LWIVHSQPRIFAFPGVLCVWLASGFIFFGCVGNQESQNEEENSFLKRVQKNPDDAEAQFNLALTYQESGDQEKSLEAFQKTPAINPRHLQAHFHLAVFYFNTRKYSLAIEEYQKIGKNREALDLLEKAVKIIPTHPQVLYDLGALYFSLDNYDESVKRLEKILQSDANHANAHFALGASYHKLEMGSKAIEYSKIAENLFSKTNNSFMMKQAQKNLDLYKNKYRPPVNRGPR